ncbi:MAG TPA: EAL domain-containing protein, partial [Steroidobacteraceae bacterium]|nr:EAL domain-containing protein [Steroidobacteraceae bacterium]
ESGYGQLVEVYIPIRFSAAAPVAGAFEIYQAYEPVAGEIAAVERDLSLGLGGGLAVLYLALLGIVHGGARTISRQNRELELAFDEQERMEQARDQLAAIIDATPDYVSVAGRDGQIRYLNRAGRRLLGFAPDDDLSKTRLLDHFPLWARTLLTDAGMPGAERAGVWSGETALLAHDGEELPVSQVLLAHSAPSGGVEFFSSVARDISERKHFEAQLLHLVGHDPLTNLFNRRRFQEELERELAQTERMGTQGALLFLDLDGFKGINDSFGHRVGDELLMSLAGRLRTQLPETGIPARLGGDEFAVLLPQTGLPQARAVAERVLETIRRHTLLIEGDSVEVTASLGIAVFPDHGESVEELLVHADFAMYQAKERRDAYSIYTAERDARAAFTSFLTWEHRLRDALERDRFVLHAQPIRDLRRGDVQYELLLRLTSEHGGLVLPDAFMGVAERSGLIRAIDRWVVRQAIRLIAAHQRSGRRLCLEVNLSGKAFADAELLPLIEGELSSSGIDPALLVLEITETAAIADINEARRFIGTLKRLGCRFALDDFGVGFSSFYYLKHLPVDYLKIDGSFIRNLPRDPVDQHLVKAIVEVAHGLKKQTIAEFVSDEETVRLLRQYGVDYAQGFHIGHPRPLDEILAESPAQAVGSSI